MLTALAEQIKALAAHIGDQLAATPTDRCSPPARSGTVRAAGCSLRSAIAAGGSPPASLACLAGMAPSTRQSGKLRAVSFRWACDKQLRDAVTDFAADSRKANPWAAELYDRARAAATTTPTPCASSAAPGST